MNPIEIIRRLEQRLLDPAVRRSAAEVADLLADDFTEFGASGRVFDKRETIAALQRESPVNRSMSDFRVAFLGDDVALATYVLDAVAGASVTSSRRSSLWYRRGRWQIVFHQGTHIPPRSD